MPKFAYLVLLFAGAISSQLPAEPDVKLHRDILGLRLSMTKNETDGRLKEIGKFLRPDAKRQEVWEVRDPRFSHIILGFEKTGELRYVTAVARAEGDAKRVSYGEIGALEKARQAGDPTINNFIYQWELAAEEREPETLVVARGRDPEFLATYSLKRIGEDPRRSRQRFWRARRRRLAQRVTSA